MEAVPAKPQTRQSNAVLEFCSFLEERPGLAVLDFAPASQATVSFVTNYGHKPYSEDFIDQLDQSFSPDAMEGASSNPVENQSNPLLVSRFFSSALNFTEASFDGVLVWDALEHLAPSLVHAVVERLHRIMHPGGYLLAIFHGDVFSIGTGVTTAPLPTHRYRIQDAQTVQMIEGQPRPIVQAFNNRTLEKLFKDFDSIKFFLTRDNLREVIVRR